MRYLLLACLFGMLSACSHAALMKCFKPIPENVYHCPEKVEGDFRLCAPPEDDYICVPPQ